MPLQTEGEGAFFVASWFFYPLQVARFQTTLNGDFLHTVWANQRDDLNERLAFYNSFLKPLSASDACMHAKELRQYLPDSLIPKENQVFEPVKNLGIDYWYELFNPRQILVLLKLIKYVGERSRELDKGEYGVAIAVYLALGLDRMLNYNNIATMWDTHYGSIDRLEGQYATKKSVSLGLEYCEWSLTPNHKSLGWAYEPDVDKPTRTRGGLCPVLN